jgi:NAD-dependent dihydropyrimidine dehydrogenase PreA subunit
MLAVHRSLPKPLDFWAANFFALVDAGTCEGCGICEQMCQVGAIAVSKQNRQAVVDRNRCIGCGVCVARCPNGSVSLSKKAVEVRPPKTREDLYDIIMARKKSRLEKLKLTGRLLADAVRMGRTDLIK